MTGGRQKVLSRRKQKEAKLPSGPTLPYKAPYKQPTTKAEYRTAKLWWSDPDLFEAEQAAVKEEADEADTKKTPEETGEATAVKATETAAKKAAKQTKGVEQASKEGLVHEGGREAETAAKKAAKQTKGVEQASKEGLVHEGGREAETAAKKAAVKKTTKMAVIKGKSKIAVSLYGNKVLPKLPQPPVVICACCNEANPRENVMGTDPLWSLCLTCVDCMSNHKEEIASYLKETGDFTFENSVRWAINKTTPAKDTGNKSNNTAVVNAEVCVAESVVFDVVCEATNSLETKSATSYVATTTWAPSSLVRANTAYGEIGLSMAEGMEQGDKILWQSAAELATESATVGVATWTTCTLNREAAVEIPPPVIWSCPMEREHEVAWQIAANFETKSSTRGIAKQVTSTAIGWPSCQKIQAGRPMAPLVKQINKIKKAKKAKKVKKPAAKKVKKPAMKAAKKPAKKAAKKPAKKAAPTNGLGEMLYHPSAEGLIHKELSEDGNKACMCAERTTQAKDLMSGESCHPGGTKGVQRKMWRRVIAFLSWLTWCSCAVIWLPMSPAWPRLVAANGVALQDTKSTRPWNAELWHGNSCHQARGSGIIWSQQVNVVNLNFKYKRKLTALLADFRMQTNRYWK